MLNRRYVPAVFCLLTLATNVRAAVPFDELAPSEQWSRVLIFVTLGFLGMVGFVAMLVFYAALRPASVRRKGEYVSTKPWRTLAAGVLSLLVIVLALIIVNVLPEALRPIPVIAIFCCVVYLLVSGLSAIVHELGDRVLSSLNSRFVGSAVMSVIAGSVLYAALGLVPFAGWTVQFVVCIFALGTALLGGLGRRKALPISEMPTEIHPPPSED